MPAVLPKSIITETHEVELTPRTIELVTVKEPYPEIQSVLTPGVADIQIEVSMPIVEAGEMQLFEGVAPAGTEEMTVRLVTEAEEGQIVLQPTEEISLPAEQTEVVGVLVSDTLTSEFTAAETYEAKLPQDTAEMVTVAPAGKTVVDSAFDSTAELELVLPAADGAVETSVLPDEITVELKLLEETAVGPEEAVTEERPTPIALRKDIITETYEVELPLETTELVTVKEPSPEIESVVGAGVADVELEVSVPIVEAAEMQFFEGVAPVDTDETTAEVVTAGEKGEVELKPAEQMLLPTEQPKVEDVLVSDTLTSEITIETYEPELSEHTTQVVMEFEAAKTCNEETIVRQVTVDTQAVKDAETEEATGEVAFSPYPEKQIVRKGRMPVMVKQDTMESYEDEFYFMVQESVVEEPWETPEVSLSGEQQELEFKRSLDTTVAPVKQQTRRLQKQETTEVYHEELHLDVAQTIAE